MVTDWKKIVVEQLKRHEGVTRLPYVDTVGKTTIGCGRNLTDKGLRADEIEMLLQHDISDAEDDAKALLSDVVFDGLTDVRKAVMVNMAFNLGLVRLRQFKTTIAAVKAGRYGEAAAGMRDSVWATQVKGRATELADLMEKG